MIPWMKVLIMMKYKIEYGKGSSVLGAISKLSVAVNESISKGWKPIGGSSFSHDSFYNEYIAIQSLIKED